MFYLERAVEEILSNTIHLHCILTLYAEVHRRRRRFCTGDGHVREVSPHANRFGTCHSRWPQAAHSLQDVSVRCALRQSGLRCSRVTPLGQSSRTANICSTTGNSGPRRPQWLSRLRLQDGLLLMTLLPVDPPLRLLDARLLVH